MTRAQWIQQYVLDACRQSEFNSDKTFADAMYVADALEKSGAAPWDGALPPAQVLNRLIEENVIVFRRADQCLPDDGTLPPPCTWDTTCGYGHTARLNGRVHTVQADGTVTPSYVCPSTGCTYHVYPWRLEGWNPNHVYETRVID